jgi:diguanylate cyclase (GGDEF)-like protein
MTINLDGKFFPKSVSNILKTCDGSARAERKQRILLAVTKWATIAMVNGVVAGYSLVRHRGNLQLDFWREIGIFSLIIWLVMHLVFEFLLSRHRELIQVQKQLDMMNSELKKHIDELYVLNTTEIAVTSCLRPEYAISAIIEKACEMFGAEKGILLRMDKVKGCLVGDAGYNVNESVVKEAMIEIEDLSAPLIINDRSASSTVKTLLFGELGLGCGIIAGMKLRDRLVGGIILGNKDRSFADSGRRAILLNIFAQHAAIVLENARLYESIEHLSVTDGLTGLYNYRYFIAALPKEMDRAKRQATHLSLVLIDVDDLKYYNDSYGHLAGDRLLVSVGKIVAQNTRTFDTVARYGGDEIAVILPGADLISMFSMAERIRTLVSCIPLSDEQRGTSCSISVSIGTAVFTHDKDKPEDFIERADKALYMAKRGGKNKVWV